MSSQHQAAFKWGAGPQTVHIAGSFNNWSGTATPLHKQSDGSFAADVPMPWGEKQAFKYVVDGEWKVREDEAKEWDAAGNMNNVYTAPPQIAGHEHPSGTSTPPPAAVNSVPPTTAPDTAAPTNRSTKPDTLLAASAPPAASSGGPSASSAGGYSIGGYTLGAVSPTKSSSASQGTASAAASGRSTQTTITVPATVPASTETHTTQSPTVALTPVEPTPEVIGKAAANANIGEATAGNDKTYMQQAAEYGGMAMATLGAVVGNAATAVENATGVDLTHSHPDGEAKGSDVNRLEQKDERAATTLPVGAAGATSADTMTNKPLPNGGAKTSSDYANAPAPLENQDAIQTNDIPAQSETADNHTTVPMPVIHDLSERDPRKDRTLHSAVNDDSTGTKPISSDPSQSARDAKAEAEMNPGTTGSTADTSLPAGQAMAKPDSGNANVDAPPPLPKDTAVTSSTTTAVPATPAKTSTFVTPGSPGSLNSTPAPTPVKAAHTRESTAGSDVRKTKSSFFAKIKGRFHHSKEPK